MSWCWFTSASPANRPSWGLGRDRLLLGHGDQHPGQVHGCQVGIDRCCQVGIDRCANLVCPNRAHEGGFATVTTSENVAGGHRPLVLVLYGPCAVALREVTR